MYGKYLLIILLDKGHTAKHHYRRFSFILLAAYTTIIGNEMFV